MHASTARRLRTLALAALLPLASACIQVTISPPGGDAAGDAGAPPPDTGPEANLKVVRVVDGDTIRVRIGDRDYPVRYIGIDTPETVDPRRPVQRFGKEASDRNKQLVEGKTVRLEKDVSNTDKYNRLLRYVWVDGKMINAVLVEEGFARAASYPPDVKHQDLFQRLERQAREAKRGLWGDGP